MSHSDRFRVSFSGVKKERWEAIFKKSRAGETASRLAHNQKTSGAAPEPAPKQMDRNTFAKLWRKYAY
jgi:hypothetical protein